MAFLPSSSNLKLKGSSTVTGELGIVRLNPVTRVDASYNLLPANFRSYTANGGSTDAASRFLRVQTGTTAGGYAAIQSFRTVNYKAGNGAVARFDAVFDAGGVAGSLQGAGLGSIGDELSFGFDGADFGVWYKHDGLAEVRTLTLSAAENATVTANVTVANTTFPVALTDASADANVTASEVAGGLMANATFAAAWHAEQLGATVIVSALSDAAQPGSYAYASPGASAGTFAQTTAAVAKTSEFTPKASWSERPGLAVTPTALNYYQIEYVQAGVANFYVFDKSTSEFALVHQQSLAADAASPGLGNPSLRSLLYVASEGSTTNLTLRSSSCRPSWRAPWRRCATPAPSPTPSPSPRTASPP